jgi:peptidoglycan/LPS O-acetylase OafA/YrhL
VQTVDDRLLANGDESGTAPGDRRFRPDVEGLRAVAVLLVVVYHAGLLRVTGGYVGVDVFFVISGFVITGVLLRERRATARTSVLDFYARRFRRILPAATLVLLVTVVGAYVLLGAIGGDSAADDGRWAAVFLSNFHFASVGTSYLAELKPPSPLQNYWSLSVEEQFYLVFPTLFLVVAGLRTRLRIETRLLVVLGVVVVASYWLSVAQTASTPTQAYFSPFTRAWELAIGAMVAAATPWLARVPTRIGGLLTWAGLLSVVISAFAFSSTTPYPGSIVAIPVVGTALIIGGGLTVPWAGAESLLALGPFQWMGRRSYGLYLWHWPILILVAENAGKRTLPAGESLLLVLAAVVASAVTYVLVENPLRHLRRPSRSTVLAGVAVVGVTVLALTLVINANRPGSAHGSVAVVPAPDEPTVAREVTAAASVTKVPASVQPPLTIAGFDYGGFFQSQSCVAHATQTFSTVCTLGDKTGKGLLVVYGDSHAVMWLQAFNAIAKRAHWRLVILAKEACPAEFLTVISPPGLRSPGSPYTECDEWHARAVQWINQQHPNVLVVTQRNLYQVPSSTGGTPPYASASAWDAGLRQMLDAVTVPGVEKVVLGNIPLRPVDPPACLEQHATDVQACTTPVSQVTPGSYDAAEVDAARTAGARYQVTTPWFCSTVCTDLIKNYVVYMDLFHVSSTYARYLNVVLGRSLGVPGS